MPITQISKIDEALLRSLAARLKQAAGQSSALEAAQIKVVGLDDIRKAAGRNWDRFADRIRETSKDFIERRLGEGDIVLPAGDGFLVIYADAGQADAHILALQNALNAFYLGEAETSGLSVNVERKLIFTSDLMTLLEQSPPLAMAENGGAPATAVDHDISIFPVWSVAQEAVSGYWIVPVRGKETGVHAGYDPCWADNGRHDPEDHDYLDLDLAILDRAVQGISSCLASNRRCIVGYSVHASTMKHRTRRQAFLKQLQALPADLRLYLLGRISEVEVGAPIATLADWTHQLRPMSQRMAIELHHTQRDLRDLGDVGVFSVACVFPPHQSAPAERDRLAKVIRAWAPQFKAQGLKFRIDQITDPLLLNVAMECGVDFCSGPRLWPAVAAPRGMSAYSHSQFRKDLGVDFKEPARAAVNGPSVLAPAS